MLGRMGSTDQALRLIIDRLGDIPQVRGGRHVHQNGAKLNTTGLGTVLCVSSGLRYGTKSRLSLATGWPLGHVLARTAFLAPRAYV